MIYEVFSVYKEEFYEISKDNVSIFEKKMILEGNDVGLFNVWGEGNDHFNFGKFGTEIKRNINLSEVVYIIKKGITK